MYDLFNAYWWLIFPLSWFAVSGWRSWLSYRSRRDALDVIKTYVRDGREPLATLVARLGQG